MTTKTVTRLSARDRLLAAADELFYEEGIHTVGIDRVIERAGVAKASLYNAFGSKNELVKSYLRTRQEVRKQRLMAGIARHAEPRKRLLAAFDVVDELIRDPKFRGCPFIRASGEASSGTAVAEVCEEMRTWIRSLFTELATAAGAAEPERFATKLVLLYDGAMVSAQMDENLAAAATAREMADMLLDTEARGGAD
jgi:AcrR family transcriptional regulator